MNTDAMNTDAIKNEIQKTLFPDECKTLHEKRIFVQHEVGINSRNAPNVHTMLSAATVDWSGRVIMPSVYDLWREHSIRDAAQSALRAWSVH